MSNDQGCIESVPDVVSVRELLARARQGDREALSRFRGLMDDNHEFWRHAGDLAGVAEQHWFAMTCGSDLVAAEGLRRTLASMRVELGGTSPSPLERLLIDRILVAWIQVNCLDGLIAREPDQASPGAVRLQKATTSAQRRLTNALTALATVRRLLKQDASPRGGAHSTRRKEE